VSKQRRAVIEDLVGIKEKVARKQAVADEERRRAAGGGLSVGPLAVGVIFPPGTMGRSGERWLIGDDNRYEVRVTYEQGGRLFNISHPSDSWPSATIGPCEDHTTLMQLAHLLKSGHVRVGHYDHDGVRHYRFVF
jgi:hypothetical protein